MGCTLGCTSPSQAQYEQRAGAARLLFLVPPVYDERDARKHDYGLVHLASKITKVHCFHAIVHYLQPREAVRLRQTRKLFLVHVEAAEERIVRHLYSRYYSHATLPSISSYSRFLHGLVGSTQVLLFGGTDGFNRLSRRVDSLLLSATTTNGGTSSISNDSLEWRSNLPQMMAGNSHFTATYYQGQVLWLAQHQDTAFSVQVERYDAFTHTASRLTTSGGGEFVIAQLKKPAVAVFDHKLFAIGVGTSSNSVCHLDLRLGAGAGVWVEHAAKTVETRIGAAAISYQGKLWLAGGASLGGPYINSVEVLDPLLDTWELQTARMTKERAHDVVLLVLRGELYALGGSCPFSIEKRDQHTGEWSVVSTLNKGHRSGFACCSLGDNTILVFGGAGSVDSWNSFNVDTRQWSTRRRQAEEKIAQRDLPSTSQVQVEARRRFLYGQAVCTSVATWTEVS